MPPLIKKDIFIYFTGKMVPAVVNLAVIVLALRWLGKETYGRYSLIFYFVMLVSTFTVGWVQQSVLRYLSAYRSRLKLTILRFKILSLISSFAGVLIIIIPGLLYFRLNFNETLVLSAVLLLYNYLLLCLTIEQSLFRPLRYAVREGLYNVVMLVTFIVLTFFLKEENYIILFVAMIVGLGIVLLIPQTKDLQTTFNIKWSPAYLNRKFFQKMWSFGILLSVWLSISYLFNIANRFFIKEYAGYEQVGIFSSVYDIIFKISGFACMPILLAYHPKITSLWNQGRKTDALKEARMALALEFIVFAGVLVVFMAGRSLLYDKVLHLYEKNLGWMSFILILSAFLWQAALLVHKALELLLKLKEMIIAIIVALLINVLGNVLLLPVYGYRAAALTTLIGIVVYISMVGFLSYYYMRKEVPHG